MLIQKDMKLADVIHHDHELIPVINRFNLHLGFGDNTIADLCKEKNINPEFFLTIINAYHDHTFFPKKHMQSFPASLLISYLNKSHNYYLDNKLPGLEELIKELGESSRLDENTSLLLKNFFQEYKNEFIQHIKREEEKVYPYVQKLEEALESGVVSNELEEQMKNYSIRDYEAEHEDVEEKLYDLKNILIKYLPEQENDELLFKILKELFELESDLNDHSRIEDLILVPKVETMEVKLKAKVK